MNTYVDKNYLVANDTIVLYTGTSSVVDVPDRFNNVNLSRIGKGSFSDLDTLKHLKIPHGVTRIESDAFQYNSQMKKIELPGTVKHIGVNAFYGCSQLNEIIWYNIELDRNTYRELKENSLKTTDNVYVSEHIPPCISNTGFKCFNSALATAIPKDIPVLFSFDNDKCGHDSKELFEKTDHICFVENDALESENSAFLYQMKTNSFGTVSYNVELVNDVAVKSEKPLSKEKTCIFTFDDKQTKEKNGKVYITAVIKLGYFFWQSGQKVIYNKNDYYVYSRFYLSSKEEIGSVKEDVAIYKDSELISDRKEAQGVYGKYKLLSIL